MSTVAQVMTKRLKSLGPKSSIASAAKTMRTARVGSLCGGLLQPVNRWASSRLRKS